MTEEEWVSGVYCGYPGAMSIVLQTRATDRKLRLCAVACCRFLWPWLTDERSRNAVEVAERHADALASDEELQDAAERAYEAAVVAKDGSINDYDLTARAYYTTRTPASAFSDALTKTVARRSGPLLLEIFGNPFRPVAFDPVWRTSDVIALGTGVYEEKAFDRMPILADALQDAGCDSDDILNHLLAPNAIHVRGCWALDLVLGKE